MIIRRLGGGSVAGVAAALVVTVLSIAPAAAVELQVYSVTPAFSPFNVAGRTVTIKGMGFRASTTVKFDATSATTSFVDSRTLTVTVPVLGAAAITTITVTDSLNGSDSFWPFQHTGPIFYVATTGVDTNNGTTPTTPFRTINKALTTATATTPSEVRVASGRYVESQLGILNATILSCGWAPGFATRDPDRNVTEIDGNRTGWVIRTTGIAAAAAIDGCTIRNGLRDGFGGGGIPSAADSPVLNNNVIVGNMSTTMGGGVYWTASTSYGGRPTLSNNVIIGNRSFAKNGGGIVLYTNYNSQQPIRVNITNNAIVGNRSVSGRGGGVSLSTATYSGYNTGNLKLEGNMFVANRARTGAGFDVSTQTFGDAFDIDFINNLVTNNVAVGGAGGIGYQGVGSIFGSVVGSTIAGNTAGFNQGGGFVIQGSLNLPSDFTSSDLIIWGNTGGDISGQVEGRLKYSDVGAAIAGTGNFSANPAFVSGPGGGNYLRQSDPNGPDSPALNVGSATAAALAVDPLTTNSSQSVDGGMADIGFHYRPGITPSSNAIVFNRIDPATGDYGGTEWVLIRGDGFDPGLTVKFDNINATNVIYLSETRVLAQPAAHAQGLVDVRVTNPDATTVLAAGAYRYLDDDPPMWVSTVGVVSSVTGVDCNRSVVLDWMDAVDAMSPPVVYEVYKEACVDSTNQTVPCSNFGFIPSAATFIGSTLETFYVDTNFPAGGQDPKFIYNVRARDSASPSNKEWNFGKRVSLASKITTDTTPASPVGGTLIFKSGTNNVLDWQGGTGAVSYGVYRTTTASQYATPLSMTKLATLTVLNNDLNGDGVTDTQYTDSTAPATGQCFFYKISSIDPCSVETTSELFPSP